MSQLPPIPRRAWTDPAFLHYLAANLILRSAAALFRAGLMPRATLGWALDVALVLTEQGGAILQRRKRRQQRAAASSDIS